MCSVSAGNLAQSGDLAQSEEPDEPTSIQLPSPNVEPTEETDLWSWFGKKATEQQRHRTAVVDAALKMRHYTEEKLPNDQD